jgi:hypothetical protein
MRGDGIPWLAARRSGCPGVASAYSHRHECALAGRADHPDLREARVVPSRSGRRTERRLLARLTLGAVTTLCDQW